MIGMASGAMRLTCRATHTVLSISHFVSSDAKSKLRNSVDICTTRARDHSTNADNFRLSIRQDRNARDVTTRHAAGTAARRDVLHFVGRPG